MAALQARLVDHAATMVRPGGLLVYATCSLEPAEGEAQIDRFLGSHSDFAIDPVLPDELPEGIAPHRSEEHTSELQSLMRISYAVFCLKKKKHKTNNITQKHQSNYKDNMTTA